MNPKSANALLGAAVICIVLGWIALSPSGGFFLFLTAVFFAAIPTLFGKKRTRIAGVLILAAALALTAATYSEYDDHMRSYREHVRMKSSQSPKPPSNP